MTGVLLMITGQPIQNLRVMETIKSTIQLVFLPGFRVAPICTYFNMLTLARLETRQKSGALLIDFKIFITLIWVNQEGKKDEI